ncbi:MAG: TonB-dependent receptor domain-containing protein [Chitinophagaceae bacterium]
MNRIVFLLAFILVCATSQSQESFSITGKIINSSNKEPLGGASVRIKGKTAGEISSATGNFILKHNYNTDSIILFLTCIGFDDRELRISKNASDITIYLEPHYSELKPLVFTASRTKESILRSPVSIEHYNNRNVLETPSIDAYEGLRMLKGMDLITNGLNYKQVNTRGFGGSQNTRFLQLVDGVDQQSPGLGWVFGNEFSITDLDLESAELIPGASSALYGPVAFNGILYMHSKNPFKHEGLTIQLKNGINHVNETETGIRGYTDYSLRYAKKLTEKIAFKLNAGYLKGFDWYANDRTDVSALTPPDFRGPNNPGKDELNTYGDEVARTIPGIGLVSRTGYEEKYLSDMNVYSLKLNAAMHFKLAPRTELIVQQNVGRGNSNYSGSSRYSTRNFTMNTSKVELQGHDFFVRNYFVWENFNGYYNTRTLGQIINRQWVRNLNGDIVGSDIADATWFNRYEQAYKGNIGNISANNHGSARAFADEGRFLPGSDVFENLKDTYSRINGPVGARTNSRSNFFHTEGQYHFTNLKQWVDLTIGGNYRTYKLSSQGSLFNDKGQSLYYNEYGMFLQANRDLLNDKLRISSSIRFDKNKNFKGNFTPKLSATYRVQKEGFIRASFQTGFRNPTPVDQYVLILSGPVTLLGGAPENTKGFNAYENSYTNSSVLAFNNAFTAATNSGATYQEALTSSINNLQVSNVSFIAPEKQTAFELGYKTEIATRLVIDVNAYYSNYKNFIVNTNVVRPTMPVTDGNGNINPVAAEEILQGKARTFQLYTNSSTKVSAQGLSMGVQYFSRSKYAIGGNLTYAKLNSDNINPNQIAPFNTPRFSSNVSLGNSSVYKSFGFNVLWHWQEAFDWYSTFLGNRSGRIRTYSLVDLQINKKLPKQNLMVKIGGSNILNTKIVQSYGSPAIGAVYYVSLLWGK